MRQRLKSLGEEHDVQRRNRIVHFPEDKRWLLPFSFGNTCMAFEDYPRVMYGFGAIQGWNRLLAVIPKSFRETLDASKAQMDFLVNIWCLSLIFLLEIAVVMVRRPAAWFELTYGFAVPTLASCLVAGHWSLRAAVDWGETVRASFDLYLPVLRERLGLEKPATREEEREQWTRFTKAVRYEDPLNLPALDTGSESSMSPA